MLSCQRLGHAAEAACADVTAFMQDCAGLPTAAESGWSAPSSPAMEQLDATIDFLLASPQPSGSATGHDTACDTGYAAALAGYATEAFSQPDFDQVEPCC